MNHLDTCLACEAPSAGARIIHRRNGDALVRCPRCKLMYANPQYTEEELVELYRVEYYDDSLMTDEIRDRDNDRFREFLRGSLADLMTHYPRLRGPQKVRVLDYGCGTGRFLAACREYPHMDLLGMDFTEAAASYVRKKVGVPVLIEPDRNLREMPDASFDLVTAWSVVEHLRRPREVLADMVRVLAPGGVLAVTVPNLWCWVYLKERERWFNIENPTHLAFFTRAGLTSLLESQGMTGVVRPIVMAPTPHYGKITRFAQLLGRTLNVGNELRLYSEKPATAPATVRAPQ